MVYHFKKEKIMQIKTPFIVYYEDYKKDNNILNENIYKNLNKSNLNSYKRIINRINRNLHEGNEHVAHYTKKAIISFEKSEICFTNLRSFLTLKDQFVNEQSFNLAKIKTASEFEDWVRNQNEDKPLELLNLKIQEIQHNLNGLKELLKSFDL
jgi:hypothetical protein